MRRSPLFYVGDKYKLIEQLLALFPKEINNFYEPFVGGGTVFLNIEAKKYYLNDIDRNIISIHKFLLKNSHMVLVSEIVCLIFVCLLVADINHVNDAGIK